MHTPKIAIFIIAYESVDTLIAAIERIPAEIKEKCEEIYVIDDASPDNGYYAALGYKHLHNIKKLNVFRNKNNLGYGGNQKKGYNYALGKNYDIVVMLHGDVQYAPEKIPELIKPLENGAADMVIGSRILGRPIKQGMPIWKYIGNRFLTFVENKMLGLNLSEYHSGFRAYSLDALKKVPFNSFTNNYHFDTEMIIHFKDKNLRISEIPIPTHYGPESHQISAKKSFFYGLNILQLLWNYKFKKK
jgi:glycosyltransferase involved in cell wall biosynthesis